MFSSFRRRYLHVKALRKHFAKESVLDFDRRRRLRFVVDDARVERRVSRAIYHGMNRGDRCEPIFKDDADRQRFVAAAANSEWMLRTWRSPAQRPTADWLPWLKHSTNSPLRSRGG